MKRSAFAAVVVLAAAGRAWAADLPAPPAPPPQAPAAYVAPVYNWGGIYFGVNGGYGFGHSEWTDSRNFSGLGTTGTFNISGPLAGATIGGNLQFDSFVIGAEGDFDGSWIDGKSSSAFCGAVGFGAGGQCETRNTWLATGRVRLGFAVDRVLFYGTGGGAFGAIRMGITPGGGTTDQTRVGWTAGAGVEAAFTDNLTARIEYLFVDLQNATCATSGSCGNDFVVGVGSVPANDTVKFDANLIRFGVDYKFR